MLMLMLSEVLIEDLFIFLSLLSNRIILEYVIYSFNTLCGS